MAAITVLTPATLAKHMEIFELPDTLKQDLKNAVRDWSEAGKRYMEYLTLHARDLELSRMILLSDAETTARDKVRQVEQEIRDFRNDNS